MDPIKLNMGKNLNDYSPNMQKLFLDLKKESEMGIKDGICYKLITNKGDAAAIYDFLMQEDYKFSYHEFSEFYKYSQTLIKQNVDKINSFLQEEITKELKEDDLEDVVGGRFSFDFKDLSLKEGLLYGGVTLAIVGVGLATGGAGFALAPLIYTGAAGVGLGLGSVVASKEMKEG